MSEPVNINATGQPDTPMEVINKLLGQSLETTSPEDMKELVQDAYRISNGLDPYLDRMLSPVPDACQDLISASDEHDWEAAYNAGKTKFKLKREMSAGALEGRVMKMLCAISGAKIVLEVGMFTGTSALAMAEIIPDGGKIVCLELEPYLEDFVTPFFEKAGQDHKLDIRIGDAVASMKKLAKEGRQFDVVFLDANKTGYLTYYNLAMDEKMLTPTGFIVVDNALMKGRVYAPTAESDPDSDAIREFNDIVIQDPRVEAVTLPVRDGITLVRPRNATSSRSAASDGMVAGMPPGGMSNPRTPSARETFCGATGWSVALTRQSASRGFVSTLRRARPAGGRVSVPEIHSRVRHRLAAAHRHPKPVKCL